MNQYFGNNPIDPTIRPATGDYRVVGCVLVNAPGSEPISLDEAKAHLRVDFDNEDSLITQKLVAARAFVEKATGRALVTQTILATLDAFPVVPPFKIELPRTPVVSVAWVKYDDDSEVEQTLDPAVYKLDIYTEPARLVPRIGKVWPYMIPKPSGVRVQFVAGGAADALDGQTKAAVLLMLGHFYENREATIAGTIISELPLGLQSILGQLKVRAHR